MKLKIKRLSENATLPSYAHSGDAGMDVFSTEDKKLEAGERYLFKLGFSMSFPPGFVCNVWDKSGLASKHGLKTMGGVIDSSYRGEVCIVMLNTSAEEYSVKKGDKLAQLLFSPISTAEPEEVEDLEDSSRGEDGWGSTGR